MYGVIHDIDRLRWLVGSDVTTVTKSQTNFRVDLAYSIGKARARMARSLILTSTPDVNSTSKRVKACIK